MGSLEFKLVTKQVGETSFDCGVDSINEYVRKSYYPTIAQHAYAYSICSGDKVLGYYQVYFKEILLEDFPEEISDYQSEIKDGKITAAHIRFLAIDKQYHRNKIGTKTLESIIKEVKTFSKVWPIRVITIDARDDLVEWYKNEGFKLMINNTVGQDGVSTAMFFDCMNYYNELNEFECMVC